MIGDGQSGAGRLVLAHEAGHQIVIGGQLRHDEPRDPGGRQPARRTATRVIRGRRRQELRYSTLN